MVVMPEGSLEALGGGRTLSLRFHLVPVAAPIQSVIPIRAGYCPLMMEARDGEHT